MPEETASARRLCLLVIDDERLITEALRDALADQFDVRMAWSTEDGLAQLEHASPPIDVVMCDLQLADGTGLDVYRTCRARWPGRERRIVFMTGGGLDHELAGMLGQTGNPVIEKPFELDELPQLIRRVASI